MYVNPVYFNSWLCVVHCLSILSANSSRRRLQWFISLSFQYRFHFYSGTPNLCVDDYDSHRSQKMRVSPVLLRTTAYDTSFYLMLSVNRHNTNNTHRRNITHSRTCLTCNPRSNFWLIVRYRACTGTKEFYFDGFSLRLTFVRELPVFKTSTVQSYTKKDNAKVKRSVKSGFSQEYNIIYDPVRSRSGSLSDNSDVIYECAVDPVPGRIRTHILAHSFFVRQRVCPIVERCVLRGNWNHSRENR